MDGETNQMSVDEAVNVLMERLPVPVQNFLKGEQRNKVIYEISQKYRLHTDQAGDFERAALFMLLGIYSPEEFLANLKTAGIPEQVAQGLTKEVNERIFIPLREEERALSDSQVAPVSETPEPVPSPSRTMVADMAKEEVVPNQNTPEPMPAWNPPAYPNPAQFQQPFYPAQAQTYWIPVSISPIQHPMSPYVQYGAPQMPSPQAPQDTQAPPPTVPQVETTEETRYTEPNQFSEPVRMQDTPPRPESPLPPPPVAPERRQFGTDPYREAPL